MGMSGSASKGYDCNISGTISSDKKTYTISFSLPSVMGGLTITFQNGEAPAAKVIAGTYAVWSSATAGYFKDMKNANESVVITANEDGTANLAYTSGTWGSVTYSNATVEKGTDGNYTVTGSAKYSMGMSTAKTEYDSDMTATISSDKETCNVTISLPGVMQGLTINFQNGDAPAAYALAGDYTGSVNIALNGETLKDLKEQTMTLTATADETVSIKYTCNDEELAQVGVGSMEFKGLKATRNDDGSYKVSGTSTYALGEASHPCTIDGTISKDKKTVTINVDVNGGEGIQVKVVFKKDETSGK